MLALLGFAILFISILFTLSKEDDTAIGYFLVVSGLCFLVSQVIIDNA